MTQVRRWQANQKLQWTEDDITQVARHRNTTIHHFPPGDLAQREWGLSTAPRASNTQAARVARMATAGMASTAGKSGGALCMFAA